MPTELTRGERFKDARTVHNQHGKQTIREVSKATGVSQGKIADIENDKAGDIGSDSVIKLAKHYGVSADYLLGLSDIKTQDSDLRDVCEYSRLSENVIWLARKTEVVSDVLNRLAEKFDGKNILDVPLFKFSSAFLKVVNASCSALPMVNGEIVDDGARIAQLGTALYQFNRTCIDIPNSVLLSDETLEKLETLREDLEIKEFYALLNAQKKKEAAYGEHQED